MKKLKFRQYIKNLNCFRYFYLNKSEIPIGKMYDDDREIMQFTGLKDKNGKDIYEGDIVRVFKYTKKGFIAKIEFYEGAFVITASMFLRNVCHEKIEVIGNIYENKELLENKK